jgi:hypothetical protein
MSIGDRETTASHPRARCLPTKSSKSPAFFDITADGVPQRDCRNSSDSLDGYPSQHPARWPVGVTYSCARPSRDEINFQTTHRLPNNAAFAEQCENGNPGEAHGLFSARTARRRGAQCPECAPTAAIERSSCAKGRGRSRPNVCRRGDRCPAVVLSSSTNARPAVVSTARAGRVTARTARNQRQAAIPAQAGRL